MGRSRTRARLPGGARREDVAELLSGPRFSRLLEEARKLLSTLDPKVLEHPSLALCYAVVLAATGANEEARKYFDLASVADLLPEEKALIPKGS